MAIIPEDSELPPSPRCPHCGADLPAIGMFNWACGAWVTLCVYCTECLKVLHMQVVPAAVMPVDESRIQIPS